MKAENAGPPVGPQIRIAPAVHEKLKTYRTSRACRERDGDKYGKPPTLFVLASTLIEEALAARAQK